MRVRLSNQAETEDRVRRIAQRLKSLLEEDCGCELKWGAQEPRHIVIFRDYDEEKLPVMLTSCDLRDWYESSEIDWLKDWTDKTPICVDKINIYDDHAEVHLWHEFNFNFLVDRYYHLHMILPAIMFSSRENRMKAARFIPAAVKDLEVFFKFLNNYLIKYNIDSSELVWRDLEHHPAFIDFAIYLSFKTVGMAEEEVINDTMKRAKALAECRRNFRAWLPTLERKHYYESTRVPKRRGWHYLCSWPLGIPSLEERYREELVREMKASLGSYLKALRRHEQGLLQRKPILSQYFRFYNLDGYALRLSGKARLDESLKNVPLSDAVKVDDGEVMVDRRVERLKPLPLDWIGFLRDDFPELFR